MIRVEATEKFDLGRFDEIKNIKRARMDVYGSIFVGDTCECEEDVYKYLSGENRLEKVVVKLIEYIPEKTKRKDVK